jgi:putative DeoR family transcriptional regulator (stage III sporulation protein D)
MEDTLEKRVCSLAIYMIENKSTIRAAAKHFGLSKSTVHKDLQLRLPRYNPVLHRQVREILDVNKSERHIRGGNATKQKYKKH